MFVIRLNAGNNKNGNPRRVFVVMNSDNMIIRTIDEGFTGSEEVAKQFPDINVVHIQTFETTPAAYRALLRDFSK